MEKSFQLSLGLMLFRRDREGDAHGGVLIASKSEYGLTQVNVSVGWSFTCCIERSADMWRKVLLMVLGTWFPVTSFIFQFIYK
jgi:hypothetical protein